MNKEQLPIIETTVKEFFAYLGIEAPVTVQLQEDAVAAELILEEPKMFIGEQGQTLFEIQHLLRAILSKKIQEPLRLFLDINEYRKSKEKYLRQLAKETVEEVLLLNREKELPPMAADERRIIHLEISQREGVTSESRGLDKERRVVIKPL